MLRRTIYKCSREQSIPRSRVFQEAECAENQSVLGSKVLQGEECSRNQTVLRGKMFQGAKCVEEQNVLGSKVFQRAKCSSACLPATNMKIWSMGVSFCDWAKFLIDIFKRDLCLHPLCQFIETSQNASIKLK